MSMVFSLSWPARELGCLSSVPRGCLCSGNSGSCVLATRLSGTINFILFKTFLCELEEGLKLNLES